METFVRGGSLEAITDANMKVDRCLRAGAMAMGAEVEIDTIPGYLPQRNDRTHGQIFGANVEALFGPGEFDIGGHRTGSTDMGDIAHMMPVIHPYVASAEGKTHGADFHINEPEHAYLTPAKLLAMTAIDLLLRRGRPGPRDHRRVQAGDDQGRLPRLRPRPVQEGAIFGGGARRRRPLAETKRAWPLAATLLSFDAGLRFARSRGSFQLLLDVMARLAQPDRLPFDRIDPGERNEMIPLAGRGFRRVLDPRGSVHLLDRAKLLPVGTDDLHLIPDLRGLNHCHISPRIRPMKR